MGQLQDFNVFACLTDAAFELLFIGIVLDDIKSFAVMRSGGISSAPSVPATQ